MKDVKLKTKDPSSSTKVGRNLEDKKIISYGEFGDMYC